MLKAVIAKIFIAVNYFHRVLNTFKVLNIPRLGIYQGSECAFGTVL